MMSCSLPMVLHPPSAAGQHQQFVVSECGAAAEPNRGAAACRR